MSDEDEEFKDRQCWSRSATILYRFVVFSLSVSFVLERGLPSNGKLAESNMLW